MTLLVQCEFRVQRPDRDAELFRLVSVSFYGELNKYLRDWISGWDGGAIVAINVPL